MATASSAWMVPETTSCEIDWRAGNDRAARCNGRELMSRSAIRIIERPPGPRVRAARRFGATFARLLCRFVANDSGSAAARATAKAAENRQKPVSYTHLRAHETGRN